MSIKSIVPVKVSLKTKMTQDGKSDHYHFEEDGQFVTLENGQHYLRYVEHQGSQATPVQFRLAWFAAARRRRIFALPMAASI